MTFNPLHLRQAAARRSAPRGASPPGRLRPLAWALAGASCLSALPGLVAAQTPPALPTGLTVIQGQVKASTSGQQLTVTNSNGSILHWQSFSIGAGNTVTFVQPNAASQVLNRVTGTDPSALLGTLNSNGRVWLLNPNGVIFGQDARINVAGLVASTLNLNDLDWLNGRYRFSSTAPAADIVNRGELRSSFGGHIALLGGRVHNEGLIEAPGGQVLLAAGRSIELIDTGAPNLRVRIDAPAGEALNLGTLAADGGRIDVHAAVVNQQGIVRADQLGTNAAGDIVLTATTSVEFGAGSRTSASGAVGGRIAVDSGSSGTTLLAGQVQATGSQGSGGQVSLLGAQVGLVGQALVDVSGQRAGGEVKVGGGERGQDPSVRNARAVYVGSDALIRADATGSGPGGRIVLWSDEATRAYGSFSARGGAQGGDGGFIETSGGWLDVRPARIDATAVAGRAGTWLLDPFDITISDTVATRTVDRNGADFGAAANNSRIASGDIRDALNAGNSVVITTGTGGTQAGDINVTNANLTVAPKSAVGLTLRAARNINISGSTIGSTASPLSLNLVAGTGGLGGRATLLASAVNTAGGDIVASGVGTDITAYPDDQRVIHVTGVLVSSAQLNAGTGRISLAGTAVTGSGFAVEGVGVSGSVLRGGDIDMAGKAQGSANSPSVVGTVVRTSTLAASHSMRLDGSSPVEGLAVIENSRLEVAPAASDPTAFLTLNGTNTAGGRSVGLASTLALRNGASLSVTGNGSTGQNGIDMVGLVDAATGGTVRFNAPTGSINFLGTRLSAGGAVSLLGQSVALGAGTTVASSAAGDAITIAGGGKTGNANLFVNGAGAGALSTPNGRWLVYTGSPLATSAGGLAPSFRQFDAVYGVANAVTPGRGNGFLYAEAPVVTLSGFVANKTYDGLVTSPLLANAVVTARGVSPLTGAFDPGRLSLDPAALASFSSPNAGANLGVSLPGSALQFTDAAGIPVLGYRYVYALTGNITPATLTYVANPASRFVGAANPALSGTVSGFVAGENLGNATTGRLSFTSLADPGSAAGSYAIEGGGLTAGNYRFVQAAANATALTVSTLPRQEAATGSTLALVQSLGLVRPVATGSSPAEGRTLDAMAALRSGAGGDPRFGTLPIEQMSQEELTALLAAREAFKRSLFADSIERLKIDPALADVRNCTTLQELELGTCLITEDLKQAAAARTAPAPTAAAAAPAATTSPAPAPAPSPAAPSPATPSPAAAPATASLNAPAAAASPFSLATPRVVRSAALPQIERKLALVIGVDAYADRTIPQLDHAVGDAKAVARVLENRLGYETTVLENVGKAAVIRALNRLAAQARPRDSVVVYYAGHGELVEATGLGYWQLADSDAKRPESWLSNADIARLVAQIGASQVALISDSCYSGSLVDERLRTVSGTVDPRQLLERKSVVVMSSGGNEPVFDSGKQGHSPFAYSLMNNMEKVTNWQVGGSLFERVRFAVARELPQRPRYGTASAAGHQAGGDYLFEQRQLDAAP